MSDPRSSNVSAQLQILRQKFRDKALGDFDSLDNISESILTGVDTHEELARAYRILHRLAGSAGTFGLSRLGEEARALELRVQKILDELRLSGSASEVVDEEELCGRLRELRSLLETDDEKDAYKQESEKQESEKQELKQAVGESENDDPAQFGVLVVDPDEGRARKLVDGLQLYGYECRWLSGSEQILDGSDPRPAVLIIRDDVFLSLDNQQIDRFNNLPILCLGDHDSVSRRYALADQGAEAFFCEPLDLPVVADHLERLLTDHADAASGKVLIVDDDPELLAHYKLVLSGGGMEVRTITGDPSLLLPALAEFRPDIVLMDVQMGDVSGPALARMLRFEPEWLSLPIIYLSAEQNREIQLDALARGGDDFLTKPVSDSFLLRTARVRCYRARQLDKMVSRDSLTGLLKHSLVKAEVAKEHARSLRMHHVSAVAMLDLDHFKMVNDKQGHRAGDLVIKGLANLLRHRLRKTDIIGRYGGEEFLVALPECSTERGMHLLESICDDFSKVVFNGSGGSFSVTLSVGLAGLDDHQMPEDAIEAADQALYQRKESGRNGVTVASS